jgi:hypothetical protein
MAAATTIAIVGAGIAAAGTAYSVYQGRKAEKAQKEQDRSRRASVTAEAMAASRKASREARIARARLIQSGVNFGTSGSTGIVGGASTIQQQAAVMQGDIVGRQHRALQDIDIAADIRQRQLKVKTGAGVAQVGMSIFSAAGGFGAFEGAGGAAAGGAGAGTSSAPQIAAGQYDTNLSVFQSRLPLPYTGMP